jgi:hypothetical protein
MNDFSLVWLILNLANRDHSICSRDDHWPLPAVAKGCDTDGHCLSPKFAQVASCMMCAKPYA